MNPLSLETIHMRHSLKVWLGDPRRIGRPPGSRTGRRTAPRERPPSILRAAIDRLAADTRLASDAEIVRVLLVSVLLAKKDAKVRLSVALYCNLVLDLSGMLQRTLRSYQDGLRMLIGTTVHGPEEKSPIEMPPAPPVRQPREEWGSREQVFLVFDEWLRNTLAAKLAADEAKMETAWRDNPQNAGRRFVPDLELVRELLRQGLAGPAHVALVKAYASAVRRARKSLQATLPGIEAVDRFLRDVAREYASTDV